MVGGWYDCGCQQCCSTKRRKTRTQRIIMTNIKWMHDALVTALNGLARVCFARRRFGITCPAPTPSSASCFQPINQSNLLLPTPAPRRVTTRSTVSIFLLLFLSSVCLYIVVPSFDHLYASFFTAFSLPPPLPPPPPIPPKALLSRGTALSFKRPRRISLPKATMFRLEGVPGSSRRATSI